MLRKEHVKALGNYLKVHKRQQVVALLELGWSYRRIESEVGVRRETVSRYDKQRGSNPARAFPGSEVVSGRGINDLGDSGSSKAAKVTPGSESKAAKVFPGSRPRQCSSAVVYHDEIVEKVEAGLSAKRVWQDLVEEFGYGHAYESVKRYVRKLKVQRRVVTVLHSAPGEEAQVDFFRGVATFDSRTGQCSPRLLGQRVQVRWDDKLVRVYHDDALVASHLRVAPGHYAPEPGQKLVTSSQRAFTLKLLGRCEQVGAPLRAWADKAYEARGVRALRLIQGVLSLTRKHTRESILWAADKALERKLFRYQDFKRLVERGDTVLPAQLPLLSEHPDIRSMDSYRLEDWS